MIRDKFSKLFRYSYLMGLRGGAILFKFGLSIYLARHAGLEVVGQYGLVLGLTLLIPAFARAGLFLNLSRELVHSSKESITTDAIHYLVWISAIYIICLPFMIIFGKQAISATDIGFWSAIWCVVILEHLFADIIVALNNINRQLSANWVGFFQAILTVLPIVLVGTIYDHDLNIKMIVILWAAGLLFLLLILIVYYRASLPSKIPKMSLGWHKSRLISSFYLFLNDGLSVLYQISDRYLIAWLLNMEMVGVYTLFLQLINAVFTLINSSVIQAHRPQVIFYYAKKDTKNAIKTLKAMGVEAVILNVLIGGAIGLLLPYLVMILRKPVLNEFFLLYWLILAAFSVRVFYTVVAIGLFAQKMDKPLFKFSVVSLLIMILGSVALNQLMGVYAMPAALTLSFAISSFLALYLQKQQIRT